MYLLPAIDIKNGQCVRLKQGLADQVTLYGENPTEIALQMKDEGAEWIHVVDLDGAFSGKAGIANVVESISKLGIKVELGGGMRSPAIIREAFSAGAERVVMGTAAVEKPEVIQAFSEKEKVKLVLGLDARDGMLAIRGWAEKTENNVFKFATSVTQTYGWQRIIFTDIATDGMLTGPNLFSLEQLLATVAVPVIASGGIAELGHLEQLKNLTLQYPHLEGVIVGKALYEKKFSVREAIDVLAKKDSRNE